MRHTPACVYVGRRGNPLALNGETSPRTEIIAILTREIISRKKGQRKTAIGF